MLHLAKYPDVQIRVDDRTIDPSQVWENVTERPIEANERHPAAALTIIEWKREVDRKLYLCDEHGMVFHEVPTGVPAPNFRYLTAGDKGPSALSRAPAPHRALRSVRRMGRAPDDRGHESPGGPGRAGPCGR